MGIFPKIVAPTSKNMTSITQDLTRFISFDTIHFEQTFTRLPAWIS